MFLVWCWKALSHTIFCFPGSPASRNFWTHLLVQSNLMGWNGSPIYWSLTSFMKVGCWAEGWGDLPDASAEGRTTDSMGSDRWKQENFMANTLVMEGVWAASCSLWDTRGSNHKTTGLLSVEEPGCPISTALLLRLAVSLKLLVIYVCMLFLFRFRNPSIQQQD